jgi:hypothetical protein
MTFSIAGCLSVIEVGSVRIFLLNQQHWMHSAGLCYVEIVEFG